MRIIIIITAMTLFISSLSFSDENPCTVKNGGVSARALCLGQEIDTTQKKLRQTYQKSIERIKEEEKQVRVFYSNFNLEEDFREGQIAWLKYRDRTCSFEGKIKTQSPWQAIKIEECKLKYTKQRIKYFQQILVG